MSIEWATHSGWEWNHSPRQAVADPEVHFPNDTSPGPNIHRSEVVSAAMRCGVDSVSWIQPF